MTPAVIRRINLTVKLTRNATGESVEYADDWPVFDGDTEFDTHGHLDYMWRDGNYSCDCNRDLFFRRAKGLEGRDCDCGGGLYSVEIRDESGRVVFVDSPCAPSNPS